MILDSSAVIAIMTRERGHDVLIKALLSETVLGIGAPTAAETGIVLSAKAKRDVQGLVTRFLQEFRVDVIPFGGTHWTAAVEAYARFGKGRHRARLNFGDCMAYAVAHMANQPLLFVGDDFTRTDIRAAL